MADKILSVIIPKKRFFYHIYNRIPVTIPSVDNPDLKVNFITANDNIYLQVLSNKPLDKSKIKKYVELKEEVLWLKIKVNMQKNLLKNNI